jgi:16S rRNA (cytidine1402-2'-O)-methyltransferase
MVDVVRSFGITNNNNQTSAGKLYMVATPIGNLEDMTYRAIRTLREVDLIAAEDTRQTRKLLTHYDIQARLVSYHEHNKQSSGPELIRMISEGQSIALVSDAGMPAISDPGEDLARLAIAQGIPVVPIPGASATLSALVMSGLPTSSFQFVGFLPREKKKLKLALKELQGITATVIVYESPHRLVATLEAMLEIWGNRRIALIRELTKKYEEAARGTVEELIVYLADHPPKGEYVLIVEGDTGMIQTEVEVWWKGLSVAEHVRQYEERQMSRKEAMKLTASDRGVSRRDIYQELI